jgi:hypothetical protein
MSAVFEVGGKIPGAPGGLVFSNGVSSGGSGFFPAGHWIAAKQAMIQVYPRPDSETNTFARHHWAYFDGVNAVQYQIPLGVSFGAFPYVFTLLSGAPGMSIAATFWNTAWTSYQAAMAAGYGYLQWTPTAAVTGATVSILVTDQQNNTLTITFTVSTSSAISRFIFLDTANGNDSTGTGAIGAPWQTLTKAFGSTYAATANASAICYLRGTGIYEIPIYSDQDIDDSFQIFELHTARKPSALLGFPGDPAPEIDMTTGGFATNLGGADWFMSGLNPNGFNASQASYRMFWITASGSFSYRITFDSNVWSNSGYGSSAASNATMYWFDGNSSNFTQYGFIRNCQETNRQSGLVGNNIVGCDNYGIEFNLVEGNVSNCPGSTVNGCWIFKSDVNNCSMRGNFASFAACAYPYSFLQDPDISTSNNEVCYNKYMATAQPANSGIFLPVNSEGVGMSTPMTNLWCFRNSVIGTLGSNDPNNGGPYVFQNNMVQSTNSPPIVSGSSVQSSGNVTATSGALDTVACNLTSAFLSNLGTVGAQIA